MFSPLGQDDWEMMRLRKKVLYRSMLKIKFVLIPEAEFVLILPSMVIRSMYTDDVCFEQRHSQVSAHVADTQALIYAFESAFFWQAHHENGTETRNKAVQTTDQLEY